MSPHLTLKHALHATLSVIFDVLGCHGDKMLIHKQVVFFFFITLIGLMSLNTHKHAHVIRISISSRLNKKKSHWQIQKLERGGRTAGYKQGI